MTTTTYSVALRPSGSGSVTLAITADLFALDDADRAFVLALVDVVRRHESALRPSEPARDGGDR